MLQYVVVFGEISGFKTQGAHAYFTLKDENSAISCNCFNYRKTYLPKDGEGVLLHGKVDYYVKGGRLNFNAEKIIPVGKGLLAIKLEELKAKLKSEGLFDARHKKPIPDYPLNICVITSKTGAVIKDIITTIRHNNTTQNIKVYDVRVQGYGADTDIIKALDAVDGAGYDCIIIARGGGSFEDLNIFNSEMLARAVFKTNTPIISAIGHEMDFTIIDFVSDYRAATPTGAAEYVAINEKQLKEYFYDKSLNIYKKVKNLYDRRHSEITNNTRLLYEKINNIYNINYAYVKQNVVKLNQSILSHYEKRSAELAKNIALLEAISPLSILKKGYYKLRLTDNELLKEGSKIKLIGDKINICATVDSVEER